MIKEIPISSTKYVFSIPREMWNGTLESSEHDTKFSSVLSINELLISNTNMTFDDIIKTLSLFDMSAEHILVACTGSDTDKYKLSILTDKPYRIKKLISYQNKQFNFIDLIEIEELIDDTLDELKKACYYKKMFDEWSVIFEKTNYMLTRMVNEDGVNYVIAHKTLNPTLKDAVSHLSSYLDKYKNAIENIDNIQNEKASIGN